MIKRVLITFLGIIGLITASSQSIEDFLTVAQKDLSHGNYISAIQNYTAAYTLDSARTDIAKNIAALCRDYNLYAEAMNWYWYLCKKDTTYAFQEAYYYLGMMQKNNGLYNEAINSFSRYARSGKQETLISESKKQLQLTKSAMELLLDTQNVYLQRLDRTINTHQSEFGALPQSSNRLWFTSVQAISGGEYNAMFPEFAYIWRSFIMSSRLTLAGYTQPEPLPKEINKRNTHNGSISKVPGRRAWYFVRCTGDLSDEKNCSIYYIEMSGKKFKNARKLPAIINTPGYSALNPVFVQLGDNQALYFVSDRPGGYGGKDIWYSLYKNGSYAEPVNLGSTINTPGNEITPYYLSETSTLYFSSDGLAGLGGFDIFSSKGGLNAWDKPVNLGIPFNSSGNDMYFYLSDTDSSGYYTSNRPKQTGNNKSTCCGDIFYFEWKSKDIVTEKHIPVSDSIPPETRIRALLPLALYFHNDIPDPKSTDTITKRNYRETLVEYLNLKEIYEEEYSSGLKDADKTRARQDIASFFDHYVIKSYRNLEMISEWLLEDLNDGYSVTLTVSGFASPLNNSNYNLNLSKRRIHCFINYLYDFQDGILTPYIEHTAANKAKLTIVQIPEGDSKALPFVSNNPNDKRNSVYSRSAAFERRIEIISYETNRQEPQALLKWETATLDLGSIKKGSVEKRTLKIKNEGTASARLHFVTPGCDCLSVEYEEGVAIQPGGFTEIKLTFNSESQYPGPYHEILSAGFKGVEDYIIINIAALIIE